jgi:hypothetical protein
MESRIGEERGNQPSPASTVLSLVALAKYICHFTVAQDQGPRGGSLSREIVSGEGGAPHIYWALLFSPGLCVISTVERLRKNLLSSPTNHYKNDGHDAGTKRTWMSVSHLDFCGINPAHDVLRTP